MIGIALALLLLVGAGVWSFRHGLLRPGGDAPTQVSEESAAIAEAKLLALRDDGEPARLSGTEISSLLRFRSPVWVRNTVHKPSVELAGDTIHVSGTVATDQLPSHPDLDRARPFLPDSSRIEVTGFLRPLQSGRVALEVVAVDLAGLPIPRRYYPRILERVGRNEEAGLSTSSMAIALPPGVGSARVEQGFLVLNP